MFYLVLLDEMVHGIMSAAFLLIIRMPAGIHIETKDVMATYDLGYILTSISHRKMIECITCDSRYSICSLLVLWYI